MRFITEVPNIGQKSNKGPQTTVIRISGLKCGGPGSIAGAPYCHETKTARLWSTLLNFIIWIKEVSIFFYLVKIQFDLQKPALISDVVVALYRILDLSQIQDS